MKRKYYSKNNPRPRPIGYRVAPSRKVFPPHLFDKANGNDPIPEAMEAYRDRNYRYPYGITPIYENKKGDEDERRN